MADSTQDEPGPLTNVEQQLIDAARQGRLLDLADGAPITLQDMSAWDRGRHVSAAVIRDVLRGRYGEIDPRGARLRGAVILDRLELAHIESRVPLELDSCNLPQGFDAHGATLGNLGLSGSRIAGTGPDGAVHLVGARITGLLGMRGATLHNESGPALSADGLIVDGGAFLNNEFNATGAGPDGAVRLVGARITGQLDMDGAILHNGSGPALSADGIVVDGGAFLDNEFNATGASPDGAVRLVGARITGQLAMRGAILSNTDGPALAADRLFVDGGAFLNNKFNATGAGPDGAARLTGARITGQLVMRGANLHNESGPALTADRLIVDGGALLNKEFNATGTSSGGAVGLVGARITGKFAMGGAVLRNTDGPALTADGLIVDDGAFLNKEFNATGAGPDGAVRLVGARITGQLVMRGAILHNESGPALTADRLIVVDGGAFLNNEFNATGASPDGAVRLVGARITGQLAMRGANLHNKRGPALTADRLIVDGSAFLDEEFNATGASPGGAVRLVGARITGQLFMRGAILRNAHGAALTAAGIVVGDNLRLDTGRPDGGGRALGLKLQHGQVGGTLILPAEHLPRGKSKQQDTTSDKTRQDETWVVDGLQLGAWPLTPNGRPLDTKALLGFLRYGTGSYTAQPYQQLARFAWADGHDHDARQILIAQRDHHLASRQSLGQIRWPGRAWARAQKFLLGYGWQPWRIWRGFTGVFVLAILLVYMGQSTSALTQSPPGPDGTPLPCRFSQYAAQVPSMIIPLVDPPAAGRCTPRPTAWGDVYLWGSYLIQLASWALSTLFVAGFTSIIRKS